MIGSSFFSFYISNSIDGSEDCPIRHCVLRPSVDEGEGSNGNVNPFSDIEDKLINFGGSK